MQQSRRHDKKLGRETAGRKIDRETGSETVRTAARNVVDRRPRQLTFAVTGTVVGADGRSTKNALTKSAKAFGGTLLKDKRNRTARPIDTKRPMHLVLRSTQAVGRQSFLSPRNAKRVAQTIKQFADRCGVRLYQVGNSGNHLHLLIRVTNRHTWKRFIRGLTSALAYAVGAYRKGEALKTKFWDFRPFTRVVEWGRDYRLQRDYVFLNALEGIGVIPSRRSSGGSTLGASLSSRNGQPASTWRSFVDEQRDRDRDWGEV